MNLSQKRKTKCNRQKIRLGCMLSSRSKKEKVHDGFKSYVVMNRISGCGSKMPLVILQGVSSFE
jgi:hypothetical protein